MGALSNGGKQMNIIPWVMIVLVVIAAIGNMQWFKGFFKNSTSKVWSLVAFVMCIAFYAVGEFVSTWLLYAFVATALMQLGYEVFIQAIPTIIKNALGIKKDV